MAKKNEKLFYNQYVSSFGVGENLLASKGNGLQVSDDELKKAYMKGLQAFYNQVKDNVPAKVRTEFKNAVKDYSQLDNKSEKDIDFNIIENNRKQQTSKRVR